MKETYNYDSHQVVLNWRALLEPPCPMAEPPGTFVVLRLVIPTTTGVATRVGLGTGAGATCVSSRTHPPVPNAIAMVLRAPSRTTVVACHAHRRSRISTPIGTTGGGVSVLRGGGTTGSSSSDGSDSMIRLAIFLLFVDGSLSADSFP